MKNPYQIIQKPLLSEKTTRLKEENEQVTFEVALKANKKEIKEAVESLFGVKVAHVRTQIIRGKVKRVRRQAGKRPNRKKAIVTIQEGSIELFEGV